MNMRICPGCAEEIESSSRACPYCGANLRSRAHRRQGHSATKSKAPLIIGIVVAVCVVGVGFVGIIAMLAIRGATTTAIFGAREAAHRAQCRNNLKQIGMALYAYDEAYNSFPPAYIADENGTPMHSWRVLILPFLDRPDLYSQYDFSEPWDSPVNAGVLQSMPVVFRCPSASTGATTTNYAAVFGDKCAFRGAEPIRIRDIIDGTSNTIIVGEAHGAQIPWTKPQDIDVTKLPTSLGPNGFSSSHSGGVHFMSADGSVRFIAETIDPATLNALFTRDGGEIVNDF